MGELASLKLRLHQLVRPSKGGGHVARCIDDEVVRRELLLSPSPTGCSPVAFLDAGEELLALLSFERFFVTLGL